MVEKSSYSNYAYSLSHSNEKYKEKKMVQVLLYYTQSTGIPTGLFSRFSGWFFTVHQAKNVACLSSTLEGNYSYTIYFNCVDTRT